MRAFLLVAVAILLLATRGSGDEPPAPAAPPESVAVGSLVTATGDAPADVLEEAARLGDQLVPLLAAHFEAPIPKDAAPLKVVIHATREGFQKAVLAEGGTAADVATAGGYTPKKTLVSHLWVQAEPFDTRRLVLHELTHQVQDKTFASFGPGTDVEWHREGLAEWFGWHVRGAKGLEVGRMDAIARNELPAQIANEVTAGRMSAWDIATRADPQPYARALGLVEALLRARDPDLRRRFRAWERDAWTHRDAAARFATAFEGARPAVQTALEEAWRGRALHWGQSAGWDEANGHIIGAGNFVLLVRGRPATAADGVGPAQSLPPGQRWEARARLIGGKGGAGFLLHPARQTAVTLIRWPEGIQFVLRTGSFPSPKSRVIAQWTLPSPPPTAVELALEELEDGLEAQVRYAEKVTRSLLPWKDMSADEPVAAVRTRLTGALVVYDGVQEFEDVFVAR